MAKYIYITTALFPFSYGLVEHGADINYKNRNGETHYLKHMKMEIRP